MAKISISAVLRECSNLDTLHLPFSQYAGFYLTLDNALQYPWGCTGLTQLTITICGCELPSEPGVQPYYLRSVPITLTKVETQHFALD